MWRSAWRHCLVDGRLTINSTAHISDITLCHKRPSDYAIHDWLSDYGTISSATCERAGSYRYRQDPTHGCRRLYKRGRDFHTRSDAPAAGGKRQKACDQEPPKALPRSAPGVL